MNFDSVDYPHAEPAPQPDKKTVEYFIEQAAKAKAQSKEQNVTNYDSLSNTSDATHQDVTHKNATHQDATHQDVTHKNETHQDATHQHDTHQDAPHQDATHEDATHKNDTLQDATHQDDTHITTTTTSISITTNSTNATEKIQPLGNYFGQRVAIRAPKGRTLDEFHWLSVFDHHQQVC